MSHENPHGTAEKNFQRRFSINVRCGMIDDMLIGPVILDDRITGQNYLDFLQNELPKELEGLPLATRIAMYEGRTESHEQLFFACELGTADEGECRGR